LCRASALQDEVDPLDAFMAGNTAAVAPVADEQAQQPAATADQQDRDADMTDAAVVATAEAAAAAGTPPPASTEPPDAAEEEDEVDPLDAFMAAQVMPEVAKVRFSEPAAAAVPDAEAGDDLQAAPGAEGGAAPAEGSRPATPSSGKQRPGSSKPASNRNRQRRFYDSDSSDDWSDTEVGLRWTCQETGGNITAVFVRHGHSSRHALALIQVQIQCLVAVIS